MGMPPKMPPDVTARAVVAMNGQILALYQIVAAIAVTHPDREVLMRELAHAELGGSATLGASPAPDSALIAFQNVFDSLRKTLELDRENRKNNPG